MPILPLNNTNLERTTVKTKSTILLLIVIMLAAAPVASAQQADPPASAGGPGIEATPEPAQPPAADEPALQPAENQQPTGEAEAGPDAVQAVIGTSFSYQGFLQDNGHPANGTYDLRFRLYNQLAGGTQVGSTVTVDDQAVSRGQFTVSLDFGNVFDGTAYFLQIEVRPGASNGAYTALSPRQALTATPYALYSKSAGRLFDHTNPGGTPDGDGFRVYYENSFFGSGQDAMVVEKTDGNQANPDGGIAFVNTGNDGDRNTAMSIRGDGNVGIGTVSPSSRLSVRDENHQIAIVDSNNAEKTWTITSHQSTSGLGFWENGQTGRMVIASGGNVGVGTTNPQAKLHVNDGFIRVTNDQYARINMVATHPADNVEMFIDARGTDQYQRGQLGTLSDHPLVNFTNSQPRIVVGAEGTICIGNC